MKSFDQYIKETARQQAFPVTGDVVECSINEELAIDLGVVEHTDDGVVVEMDALAQYILEHCGCTLEEDVDITTGKEQPKTFMGFNVKSLQDKIEDKKSQISLAKRNAPKSGLTVADVPKLEKELADLMQMDEAEYKGREVKLGKPMRGDVKKYKVFVKDKKTGNVKKVNFGDPNMQIRRDNPEARKNFRARHNCADKKDRTKAGYWSCRMWSKKPVSKILKGK